MMRAAGLQLIRAAQLHCFLNFPADGSSRRGYSLVVQIRHNDRRNFALEDAPRLRDRSRSPHP
jgi:hypothetical protein